MLKHADKYLSPNTVPLQKIHHEIPLLLNCDIGCVVNEHMVISSQNPIGL